MESNLVPKFNFIYYKNLLDICFSRFFSDYNNYFKNENDRYIYCGESSKSKLKTIFKTYLIDELKQRLTPYNTLDKQWYFVIGACIPKNNILLNYKSDKYFPEKLNRIVNQEVSLRYYLKEKDIVLDMKLFNSVFEELYNEFFKDKNKILKAFGKEYCNVIFLQHNRLDCITIYKLCKKNFGRSNVVNMFEKYYLYKRRNIFAINEIIDKYIHNNNSLLRSDEYKQIEQEVKQFISESMTIQNG